MEFDEMLTYPCAGNISESASLIKDLIREHRSNFKNKDGELFSYIQFRLSNVGVHYRKRDDSNDIIVSKWISYVYDKAINFICTKEPKEFRGINKQFLTEIAKLSVEPSIIPQLPDLLSNHGIILIYEPALKSLKADGATFKISDHYFVIGLSFRFSRLDNFWFTLLHELAHILIYPDSFKTPKLIDMENVDDDEDEIEADRIALNSFVERHIWVNCQPKYERTKSSIINFAQAQKIHPAIIAGRLQREENNYSIFRELTDSINTRKLVFGNE